MTPVRTLILDGHSRAAIEATQALGKFNIGVAVSAPRSDVAAFHSRYTLIRLMQPSAIPESRFLEWLYDLDSKFSFDLVVPSTENSLVCLQRLPDHHDLRCRAVLPASTSLDTALDKSLTLKLASELSIRVPATRMISVPSLPRCPDRFPVVLKPIRSRLTDGDGHLSYFEPVIVQNEAVWETVLKKWLPRMVVLEQEYITGCGFGVELLYREGQLAWYMAHERLHEWPLTGGASTYRRATEPPSQALSAATRLLDALKWHGVAMVEFKRCPDDSFVLMEVNPRLWGSLALSIDAGVNFPVGLWKIATGEPLPPQPQYRRGLRTRHWPDDFRWLKANLVADRANPLLLLRPRLTSLLECCLVLANRERWDHFQWRDPGPLFHEVCLAVRRFSGSLRFRWRTLSILCKRRRSLRRAASRLRRGEAYLPSVLFLCYGNICRSPFAEVVMRARAPHLRISSAGLYPSGGRQSPLRTVEEAQKLGYDLSDCRSVTVTAEHVRAADLILVMDLKIYDELAMRFPSSRAKAVLFGLFADPPVTEIADPYRAEAAVTQRVFRQIISAADGLAALSEPLSARSKTSRLDTSTRTSC